MELRGNTNVGIWCMGNRGNPVQTDVGGGFDVYKENEVPISARDVNRFDPRDNPLLKKNRLFSSCLEQERFSVLALGLLIPLRLVPLAA